MQTTSERGRAEIASHEGIVLSPYLDSVGVWTVYVGHTASAGAPDPVKMARGVEHPIAEAMQVFQRDLARFEARVRKAFTRPLTQEQFDAAVSFDFNTGGIDKASWVRQFNAGKDAAAKKAFMNWSKPPEIIPRRKAERDLFFDGRYSGNGIATVYPADKAGNVQWSRGRRVKVLDVLGSAPVPPPRPDYRPVPVEVPGLDKPAMESSTVWSAIAGFIATALSAVGGFLSGLGEVAQIVAVVGGLVLLAVAGFAAWRIVSERMRYARAARDIKAALTAVEG